jgi:hypothetical protein
MNQRCRQHTSLDANEHQSKRKPQCSRIVSEREKIILKNKEIKKQYIQRPFLIGGRGC